MCGKQSLLQMLIALVGCTFVISEATAGWGWPPASIAVGESGAALVVDSDQDGVGDAEDDFPYDPTESIDTDGDGIGNNADEDDDNDGQLDRHEITCGSDSLSNTSLSADLDGDNIPDCHDLDDDNDGVAEC